jgi:hypothetical protein
VPYLAKRLEKRREAALRRGVLLRQERERERERDVSALLTHLPTAPYGRAAIPGTSVLN